MLIFGNCCVSRVSPCYTGLSYHGKTCICNINNNFVNCSGTTAVVLEGYWYGINDHQTVTISVQTITVTLEHVMSIPIDVYTPSIT